MQSALWTLIFSFVADVYIGSHQFASKILHIKLVVPMKFYNNKAVSCVYFLDVWDSTDYLFF